MASNSHVEIKSLSQVNTVQSVYMDYFSHLQL